MECKGFEQYDAIGNGVRLVRNVQFVGYFLTAFLALYYLKAIQRTGETKQAALFTTAASHVFISAALVNLASGAVAFATHCIWIAPRCSEGSGPLVRFIWTCSWIAICLSAINKSCTLRFLILRMGIIRMPREHNVKSKKELKCLQCLFGTVILGFLGAVLSTWFNACVPGANETAKDRISVGLIGGFGMLFLLGGLVIMDCFNVYLCCEFVKGLLNGVKNARKITGEAKKNSDLEILITKTCKLGIICLSSTMIGTVALMVSFSIDQPLVGYVVSFFTVIIDSVINCSCIFLMRGNKDETGNELGEETAVSDQGEISGADETSGAVTSD